MIIEKVETAEGKDPPTSQRANIQNETKDIQLHDFDILIGVTEATPSLFDIFRAERKTWSPACCLLPGSRMYWCRNSLALPGGTTNASYWGATGQRVHGDRVGMLVEEGSLSVYVNGARLGPGPMATDLPQHVSTANLCAASYTLNLYFN